MRLHLGEGLFVRQLDPPEVLIAARVRQGVALQRENHLQQPHDWGHAVHRRLGTRQGEPGWATAARCVRQQDQILDASCLQVRSRANRSYSQPQRAKADNRNHQQDARHVLRVVKRLA